MGGDKKRKKTKKRKHKTKGQTDRQKDTNQETENLELHGNDNEASPTKSLSKRNHSETESDHEKEPKKKKKKVPQISGDTSDNKNKKSIRQAKREKFAQRQAETQAAAKEQTKSECLNYLSQWKHNRQNWKFMKAKQVWIYKNKFSESLIPNDSWPLLLEYFESAKGNIRNMLLTDAKKIIKQMDDWTETQNNELDMAKENESDDEEQSKKPSETIYKRARELIQFLQE